MILGYGHHPSELIARLCVNVHVIFQSGTILGYLVKVVRLDRFQVHLALQLLVLADLARLVSTRLQRMPQPANYAQQEHTQHRKEPLIQVPFIP